MHKLIIALLLYSWMSSAPEKEIGYRQLCWADFQGKPDYSRPDIAAYTEWQLNYSCEDNNGSYTFSVKAVFLPEQSWTKTRSLYVLSHETAHFQIAEIYSRQLQKAFDAINGCKNCKLAGDSMYNTVFQATCAEQQAYDSATDRGLDRGQQAEWGRKINLLLRKN